jgi:hypothetical protein
MRKRANQRGAAIDAGESLIQTARGILEESILMKIEATVGRFARNRRVRRKRRLGVWV